MRKHAKPTAIIRLIRTRKMSTARTVPKVSADAKNAEKERTKSAAGAVAHAAKRAVFIKKLLIFARPFKICHDFSTKKR